MKKHIKTILILLAAAAVALLIFLLWPVGKTVHDPGKYLKVNDYTDELLKSYVGILPERIPDGAEDVEYTYSYHGRGDRSFTVLLSYTADGTLFSSEAERLGKLAQETRIIGGKTYYICAADDLDEFFNDEILDGFSFKIEVAVLDDSDHSITYLVSDCQDNLGRPWDIENVLLPIYCNK